VARGARAGAGRRRDERAELSEVVQRLGAVQPKSLIVVLGALSAFAPMSVDMYLPAFPALAKDFGVDESQIQLTLTACLAGLAVGQVLAGPVSDALGRRRPLVVGLVAYVAASLACALATSVDALTGLRVVQGLAGAASIVIARAIVRDLYVGAAAARVFSLLMLVLGVAPIVAPVIGAQLLEVTSWRGLFVVLAGYGALLLAVTVVLLPETLPAERRRPLGLGHTLSTFRRLLAERAFVGYCLGSGLAFAAMFAYIAGSPFVLQEIYGLSPQVYGAVFAVNALGIVVASQVSGRLVGRVSPRRLMDAGLALAAGGGLALLGVVWAGGIGLAGVLPALFVSVSSVGLVTPNSVALALSGHPDDAGSASALLGVTQFLLGALIAPLVGLWGTDTALPMSAVIAALGVGAALTVLVLARPERAPTSGSPG
jgi:DHA1 family bicyclomycin/chloramphenicol resistance-like MFS transporter